MRRILALADDLTGALETGARWAAAGAPALVALSLSAARHAGALSLDTETRHLSPECAYRITRAQIADALQTGFTGLFQKTDSTLRGNIAPQFRALLEACPGHLLVFSPAYPELGRTVQDGILRVHGQLLAETAFASDIRGPSRESSVAALLRAGIDAPIHCLPSAASLRSALRHTPNGSVLVCDASTNADLLAIVETLRAADRPAIVAGASVLAGLWCRGIFPSTPTPPPRFQAARWLIVSGSRHPVSRSQLDRAALAGCPHFVLPPDPGGDSAALQLAADALRRTTWTAISSPAAPLAGPGAVAARLALLCRSLLERIPATGLIVFGGDTAFHLMQALRIQTMRPCLELLPGVPLSEVEFLRRPLPLVTKAGGFGDADVLDQIRSNLEVQRCCLP